MRARPGSPWVVVVAVGFVLAVSALVVAVLQYRERHGDDIPAVSLEVLTILGRAPRVDNPIPGFWKWSRPPPAGLGLPQHPSDIEHLLSLPYLQGYKEASPHPLVISHEPGLAYPGLNLVTSGHAPAANLMDMEGNILHVWERQLEDVWPDVPYTVHSTFWRRVHPLQNGELLAIFEGIGLLKLDRESQVLWAYRDAVHHNAFVGDDGRIYVLTRKTQNVPRINPREPVVLDYVSILSSAGQLLEEHSILDCFDNSAFRKLLIAMRPKWDLLHVNWVWVLDGSMARRLPQFSEGRVLVSLRHVDVLAVLDLAQQTVVWAVTGSRRGLWRHQHDPIPVGDDAILLFDNEGRGGRSRAVEFDPLTLEIRWEYPADDADPLFSPTCGTSQRLPNGNTLITESENGRAVEVTREGRIVWEFYSPYRTGPSNRLVAALFEVARFDADYFPWLGTRGRQ